MALGGSLVASRMALTNGASIPQIHLGVYMMSGRQAYRATQWALLAGYRAFDSAQMYANEREVGTAILDFLGDRSKNTTGLQRKDIFYTSKLSSNASLEVARKSIRQSVQVCGLGYIDLFLLHSPYGGKTRRLASWQAIQEAIQEGIVKLGGVSNFGQKHLEELLAIGDKPLINQIEVHPFNTRTALATFCQQNGIVVEAYAPLVRAMRFSNNTILDLAKKYSCSPAQLLVRWSLQHGYIPLPKSVSEARIQENAHVDFFVIEEQDMATMDSLDEDLVTDWDPLDAD